MTLGGLHAALSDDLRRARRLDGGYATSPDGASEVEPTSLAALALPDDRPRSWLAARQRTQGGFQELDGRECGSATVALAALAIDAGEGRRRALEFAIAQRSLGRPDADPNAARSGWGWTTDARSTVEPTSRVLLAVNALRPSAAAVRREATGLLATRQCHDGGWN